MHFKFDEQLPQETNLLISSAAVVLKDLFEKYEQFNTLETAEKVTSGVAIVPIVLYEPKRIQLNSKAIKDTWCSARLVVYSKQPKADDPCPRFVHAERCTSQEEALKKIPAPIREAYFDGEGDSTLSTLLVTLGGLKSDRVSYFYSAVTCEGVITHCVAVVHEDGEEGNPFCITTGYLTISIGK